MKKPNFVHQLKLNRWLTGLFIVFIFQNGYCQTTESSEESERIEDASQRLTKGSWNIGLTLNFKNENKNDLSAFVYDVENQTLKTTKINSAVGYFVRKDMSVGLKYSIKSLNSDLLYINNSSQEIHTRSANIENQFILFLRNYFPVNAKRMFYFFNETQLGYGFSTGLTRKEITDGGITKTYEKGQTFRLGISPGVMILLTKGFAFEASMNFLGLTYNANKIKEGDGPYGKSDKLNFNFDINLLSINFGLAYYFK